MCRECLERFSHHRLQRKPLVSNTGMLHGTCITHVPWCTLGSLTRGGEKTFPEFPPHAQPAILRIWQEDHLGHISPCVFASFAIYYSFHIQIFHCLMEALNVISIESTLHILHGNKVISMVIVIAIVTWYEFPRSVQQEGFPVFAGLWCTFHEHRVVYRQQHGLKCVRVRTRTEKNGVCTTATQLWGSRPSINIISGYRDSQYEHKTIARSSYPYNEDFYIRKTASWYWNGPKVS